jgi:hypothetical protein
MGLDVTAFSKVVRVGDSKTDETIHLYPSSDFPKQADGLKDGHYSCADSYSGPSMPYGQYNQWREQLARLAGVDMADAWTNKLEVAPFLELINFSDCDGLIGAATSKKLAADFATFDAKARKWPGWFYENYVRFHNCFKLAADQGAVKFS